MRAMPDPMIGQVVLDRYRVVRVLAQGGMGVVYLGRTEGAAGFSRPVVIKRILPHLIANPRMAGLFVREARILSELQHQNIVSILDFGEQDNAYLMVLEYVRGYDLGLWHRFMRETGSLIAGDVAIQIVIRALDAMHHAHTFKRPDGRELNIVHRDISPGNILMDTEGHVKLLDFGIARFSDDGGEYQTRSGEFKGKAAYTAPEVFRGQDATAQADIFSTGVVLYKILAGFNPFEGDNAAQTMKRITDMNPQPITYIRSDLQKQLDGVLAKALAKKTRERYQSAADFAEDLRGCRRQGEDAVNTRLIADIQRDFMGDMPGRLGLEPLNVLDASWRWMSTVELQALVDPAVGGAGVTEAGTSVAPGEGTAPRGRKSGNPLAAVGAVLGLGGLALGGWAMTNAQPKGAAPPSFVVVQKNDNGQAAPAKEAAEPASQQGPVEPKPEPDDLEASEPETAIKTQAKPRSKAATPRERDPDPAALTRSFRRHQNKIESCFEQNADVDGQPEVSIRFQVATSGKVETATTVPSQLSGTPLGGCLVNVAKQTNFGAQPRELSFSIPLKARQFTRNGQ